MSFFTTSDNENIFSTGEFEAMEELAPIPHGTKIIAMADEIGWKEYEGENYISVRWEVLDGEYKGRKVFQKIKPYDEDDKKADKAKKMLAAIDANAGGNLLKSGKAPDDGDLAVNILNKPMILKLAVWEIDGKSGNWVMAVSKDTPENRQTEPKKPSFDDDIDF